ncbi:MAG: PEP/pyruvate-binding domain-containing protein, partial [Candidatus Bipolaricaulia bacterium]
MGAKSIGELARTGQLPSGVRLIGEGHVGGKAAGIIFVKEQMERAPLTPYDDLITFPDSTVLTTAVYDEFIAKNRLAAVVEAKCRGELSFEELIAEFLAAALPQWVLRELREFLARERRPLVVRSSSLVEDDPHHSFAGIYLSEFLPNTGALEERLRNLISSIKRVYASTFGENARAYRKRHGLPWEGEKMAVLLQNMVGSHYPGKKFYPLVSGVAFSRNFYPWTERLKQEDGVARVVIGVGTRAVGRAYARVFSPKLPGLHPEGTAPEEVIRYAQEIVDVLDMAAGGLRSVPLSSLENPHFPKVLAVAREDGTLVGYT